MKNLEMYLDHIKVADTEKVLTEFKNIYAN